MARDWVSAPTVKCLGTQINREGSHATGCVASLVPTLGLYASQEMYSSRMFGEQTQMFKELVEMGAARGADVVVLPPGFKRTGKGWRYSSVAKKWIHGAVALPAVVLRRSGSFRHNAWLVREDLKWFEQAGRLHTLPLACSNKWTFYRQMRAVPHLRKYLPLSQLAVSSGDVWELIHQHHDIYVKPVSGAQGVSVYRLQMHNSHPSATWETRLVSRETERRTKRFTPQTSVKERQFADYASFCKFWGQSGLKQCIVQQTIPLPRLSDGSPFDFRWLVQYTDHGPQVIARVARIGSPHSVTTNIHTGGRAVPAEQALSADAPKSARKRSAHLDELALAVARRLQEKYGKYAEVGIDLALRQDGEPVVFEVNPTPGRRMLRTLPGRVREMSLRCLIEYAIRATGISI